MPSIFFVNIDYWRAPSRRFYAAKAEEYEEIQERIRRRKKQKSDGSGSSEGLYDAIQEV